MNAPPSCSGYLNGRVCQIHYVYAKPVVLLVAAVSEQAILVKAFSAGRHMSKYAKGLLTMELTILYPAVHQQATTVRAFVNEPNILLMDGSLLLPSTH